MSLLKFKIIVPKDGNKVEHSHEVVLINTSHIISCRPFKLRLDNNVVQAYKVRTVNGKRYIATEIPNVLSRELN